MEKFKDKKKIMKVCLVAHGHDEDSLNQKTDSPTCSHKAMHIVMLTASIMKWQVESLGFTSVFLQSDKLKRDIS